MQFMTVFVMVLDTIFRYHQSSRKQLRVAWFLIKTQLLCLRATMYKGRENAKNAIPLPKVSTLLLTIR